MIKDAAIEAVYGRRGSGKSTRVKIMVQDRPAVLVFDPKDEYADELSMRRVSGDGADWPADLVRAIQADWQSRPWVSFVPRPGSEPEQLHRVAALLDRIQAPYFAGMDDRKFTLVIEEMDLGYPVHKLPAELDGMPRLCNQGRHAGIAMIGVTQRPANISATFRGNVEKMFIFPLAWAGDQQTILQMIGPERKSQLIALENHQYIYIDNGQFGMAKNPPIP